jgi:hypothetical protein
MAKRKKLTADQRERLRELATDIRSDLAEMRRLLEAAVERARSAEADAVRRRARRRRFSFGLFGR